MPPYSKKTLMLGMGAALAALALTGCGAKEGEQAAAPAAANFESNAAAALDTAATPAAGTVAANVATATDPGPPPANIADVRDAAGDEGAPDAKARVSAAAEAGRLVPPGAPSR